MTVLGGVSENERLHLARLDSESRVNAVYAQILAMVNARRARGGVGVDAPVLSRFHQVGMMCPTWQHAMSFEH